MIVIIGTVAVIGAAIAIMNKQNIGKDIKHEPIAVHDQQKLPKVKAVDLHKDILRQIASGKDTIAGISPSDAEKELERRSGNEPEMDKHPANVKKLP